MSNEHLWNIQKSLKAMRHDPGPIDGLWGRRTKAALESLVAHSGQAMPYVPEHTIEDNVDLPWITEAMTIYGLHETRDKDVLKEYLRSDGRTLGDPDKLPWCGDFAETVIKNSLPDEPWTNQNLRENPYWARNWIHFGIACPASFGAMLTFSRGSGGHIGIAVGEVGHDYLVLGGNQGDRVSIVPIAKKRLLASRWPSSYPYSNVMLSPNPPIKNLGSKNFGNRSTNEA